MYKKTDGLLSTELLQLFPSKSAWEGEIYGTWIPNFVGLEQFLAVAAFLDPEFFRARECTFWDRRVAENITFQKMEDLTEAERYMNHLNVEEYLLLAADEALEVRELVEAFARTISTFWNRALKRRFPEHVYCVEVAEDLFDEIGLCVTFSRVRDGTQKASPEGGFSQDSIA